MPNSRLTYIYFSSALIAATGSLIWLLTAGTLPQQIMQVISLIAGTTFFAGISLLFDYVREPRTAPLIQINFNGQQLKEDLGNIVDAEYTEIADDFYPSGGGAYADDDLIIAMAKIRIDLERNIKRLARVNGVVREGQRFDMQRSLAALKREEKLPGVAVEAIQGILPICNRAIHGEKISVLDARNVIEIAQEVMIILEGEFMKIVSVRR